MRPRCPRCGSDRWVSASLDGGYTRRAQCVPCGAIHVPVIGPGWQSPRYYDPEAVHPDYRESGRAVTPDPYGGTDLLADVFEGTEHAPLPVGGTCPASAAAPWFYPHPDDTRWKPRPRAQREIHG